MAETYPSIQDQIFEIRQHLARLAVTIGREGNLDPILAIDEELASIEADAENRSDRLDSGTRRPRRVRRKPSRREAIPFVAVGHGEEAPWEHLPLTCPRCGEENLPLLDSEPSGLHYIKHCGGAWMRGPLTYRAGR